MLLVNWPADVVANGYGRCTADDVVLVRVEQIIGTTSLGELLYVYPDSWALTGSIGTGDPVRIAMGTSQQGVVLAQKVRGGEAGSRLLAGTMATSAVPGGSGRVTLLGLNGQTVWAKYDHLATDEPTSTLELGDAVQVAYQANVYLDPDDGTTSTSSYGWRIVSWPCPPSVA
jgi:hypothetical protein